MSAGERSRLLIATSNRHKLAEFRAMLPERIELVGLDDFGVRLPDESGTTFAAIADTKAMAAARATGELTLADDSGLEVVALGGAPGVRSARFAEPAATDASNRAALLAALSGVANRDRGARFVCALSLARPDRIVGRSRGECAGRIAVLERGGHGFGYDPIFLLPDGRSFAELAPHEKNQVSHRSIALRAMLPVVIGELGP